MTPASAPQVMVRVPLALVVSVQVAPLVPSTPLVPFVTVADVRSQMGVGPPA